MFCFREFVLSHLCATSSRCQERENVHLALTEGKNKLDAERGKMKTATSAGKQAPAMIDLVSV